MGLGMALESGSLGAGGQLRRGGVGSAVGGVDVGEGLAEDAAGYGELERSRPWESQGRA